MTNKPNITVIQETKDGVWLWELPSGKYLADTDGNYLSMNGTRYDLRAQRLMKEEATALGFGDGRAVFKPGSYKVSDSEYELQMERLHNGHYADPLDPGILETYRDQQEMKGFG